MALFTIGRDVSAWDQNDLEAGALRSKMCVPWFEGMRWVISYLDTERGYMTCIYEARSEDDIRAHARFAGLPVGEIRPVVEVDPAAVGTDDLDETAGNAPAGNPVER